MQSFFLSVGLLKQLLMQQLGMSEKEPFEGWQRLPRHRTVAHGIQGDSAVPRGLRHSDSSKTASPAGTNRTPSGVETHRVGPCHEDPWTSGEFTHPGSTAFSRGQLTDSSSTNPDPLPTELEGVGAEESGEHFFDAREAHSDENPSEGEGAERKEEEAQLRISGE